MCTSHFVAHNIQVTCIQKWTVHKINIYYFIKIITVKLFFFLTAEYMAVKNTMILVHFKELENKKFLSHGEKVCFDIRNQSASFK